MRKKDFGFRYMKPAMPFMSISSIGWESTRNPNYRWNGRTRGDKFVLFQYTLSGHGHLVYEGVHYDLPKHHGFFARIPDDHTYYYETEDGTPWEFIYLTAEGTHIFDYWSRMMDRNGPVIALRPDAPPIAKLWSLMEAAQAKAFHDQYDISAQFYDWLMECMRVIDGKPLPGARLPEAVMAARKFMEHNYYRPLTLEDIAAASGTSKYHFCRLYVKHTSATPIQHLARIRIAEAARLLRQTSEPIGSIAIKVGFDNSSYFGKVFRGIAGLSPQQFRDGGPEIAANQLFFD